MVDAAKRREKVREAKAVVGVARADGAQDGEDRPPSHRGYPVATGDLAAWERWITPDRTACWTE